VALASLSYASATVYARRHLRQLRPMVLALGQVGLALPIVTVLTLTIDRPWTVPLTRDAIAAVAWLGILGSGLAYLISFGLLARWDATRTSLVTYLLPIVGIVLGVTFLAEPLDTRILLGAALITGGVGLVNSRRGSRRLFGRAGRRASMPADPASPVGPP